MKLLVMEEEGMDEVPWILPKMRQKGNLVLLSSSRGRAYVKRNYFRFCNGFLAFGGRCGFTCCAKVVDKVIEDLPGLRMKLEQTGASIRYHDLNKSYSSRELTGKERIRGIEAMWDMPWQLERLASLGEIRLIGEKHAMLRLRDVTEAESVKEMAAFLKVPLEDVLVFGKHGSLLEGHAHAYDLREMPVKEALAVAGLMG